MCEDRAVMSTDLPDSPSLSRSLSPSPGHAPGHRAQGPHASLAAGARPAPGTLHELVIDWFGDHARDLPWRRPDAGAWSVMVSEFMLQQTPVSRVLPVHREWLDR